MQIRMVLAGNPNSGKTTLFNALTGAAGRVGNWPGVTVEKKEGTLLKDKAVTVIDLPGIYSLSPYSLEEKIARDYLQKTAPELVVNVADAASLERSLYLTLQLLELGLPMVVALNRMDIAQKKAIQINTDALSALLGCPVVAISAAKGLGLDSLVRQSLSRAKSGMGNGRALPFSPPVERALRRIAACLPPQKRSRANLVRLLSKDEVAFSALGIDAGAKERILRAIADCEAVCRDDTESIIANERYQIIADIVKKCVRQSAEARKSDLSDKIDRILTHRVFALPIFVLFIVCVYYLAVTAVGGPLSEWLGKTALDRWITPALTAGLQKLGTRQWLADLVTSGIVRGFFSVLSFIPQLIILFFLLALLEECGYMARAAFITDRIFRAFGLSGKAFIPMLVGTGCSVPAILAARTLERERERKMMITTTSFIPCSAKMPIILLTAASLFNNAWWVAPSAYLLGILSVMLSGTIFNNAAGPDDVPFIMELPPLCLPGFKSIFRSVTRRIRAFVKKAGSVILLASVLVWLLSRVTFRGHLPAFTDDMAESVLAVVGKTIAPVFGPLGFSLWQAAVATLMGLLAKEEIVGVFGVLYGLSGPAGTEALSLPLSPLGGYAFLAFNLLCIPCVAAVGAIYRETNSLRRTFFALLYQSAYAYAVALIIYQTGLFWANRRFTPGTAAALGTVALFVWLIFSKAAEKRRPVLSGAASSGTTRQAATPRAGGRGKWSGNKQNCR